MGRGLSEGPKISEVSPRGKAHIVKRQELSEWLAGASLPLVLCHGAEQEIAQKILIDGLDPYRSQGGPYCAGLWADSQESDIYRANVRFAARLNNPLVTSYDGYAGGEPYRSSELPGFTEATDQLLDRYSPEGSDRQARGNQTLAQYLPAGEWARGQRVAQAALAAGHDAIVIHGVPRTRGPQVVVLRPEVMRILEDESRLEQLPSSLEGLEEIKTLGGLTGAKLYRDLESGKRYVVKNNHHEKQVKEELEADRAYRSLGVKVPLSRAIRNQEGRLVKIAAFIGESRPLGRKGEVDFPGRDQVISRLRGDFAADALLANWDLVSGWGDNVIVTNKCEAIRVDMGGCLRSRAQGGIKELTEKPLDLWTIRDNHPASEVVGEMSWSEVETSIERLSPRRQALLAAVKPDLAQILDRRLDWMEGALSEGCRLREKGGLTEEGIDQSVRSWMEAAATPQG